MAIIYNSDVTKELRDGGKISLRDVIPNQLAEKVVPVMEVNPKLLRRCNVVRGVNKPTSGGATIYTTPTDKDFFLVAMSFSLVKDATCDAATGDAYLNVTIDGNPNFILRIPIITLTAQNQTTSICFPIPIKIDRNVGIAISATSYTAGLMSRSASLIGYEVINTTA